MLERTLTVPEVAAQLRINEETVRRWLRSGRLKGVRIGGPRAGYRIPEPEVARILSGTDQQTG
jgi:excisionase family DNA binding protein